MAARWPSCFAAGLALTTFQAPLPWSACDAAGFVGWPVASLDGAAVRAGGAASAATKKLAVARLVRRADRRPRPRVVRSIRSLPHGAGKRLRASVRSKARRHERDIPIEVGAGASWHRLRCAAAPTFAGLRVGQGMR